MRKCLMVIGAALLLNLIPALSVEAQSRRATGFALAPNRSKLRVDGQTSGGWRWGWQGGVYVQQPVAADGLVGLRLEGWYIQKGEDTFGGAVNSSIRINYIEVPLLLVVGTPFDRRSAMRISVYGGGTFGIRVSCGITVASGPDVEKSSCADAGADVSSTDYGLLGGASLGLRNFFIDFRYGYGLKDILSNPDVSVKNSSYALSFGVMMPLGN